MSACHNRSSATPGDAQPAFLPTADGAAASRGAGAGGIAFTSLKQRRISHASNTSSPVVRDGGGGSGSYFSASAATLSRLGSSVSSYMTGTGASDAAVKDQ